MSRIAARVSTLAALLAGGAAAWAQPAPRPPAPLAESQLTWQQCARLAGQDAARLACFDRWSQQQTLPAQAVPPAPKVLAETPAPGAPPADVPVDAAQPATRVIAAGGSSGCRDRQYSQLSRFWELEAGTDCGTLGFRGYRPLSVSASQATDRPQVPTSPAPGHTGTPIEYQSHEMRLNLSVRTKLAQGLLAGEDGQRRDSLWFAYSQQSTWQLFNGAISRPFRTTDHEPELIYVYPTDVALPGGWRWRYAGVGLVHQSNGQSLPLSRSWNRVYLMGGMELGNEWRVTAKFWKRLNESILADDNPDISNYIGRAELGLQWQFNPANTLALTVRNNLRASGKGSARLEWFKALGDPATSNLRLHAQLFHGYGDTLVDYNRKRTVFSLGLSLIDF